MFHLKQEKLMISRNMNWTLWYISLKLFPSEPVLVVPYCSTIHCTMHHKASTKYYGVIGKEIDIHNVTT